MSEITDKLQAIQLELSAMQNKHRDTTPQFWAFNLAWEAVRFAWYVCKGDELGAREKLHHVKQALIRVGRFYPGERQPRQ